jgi:hypothetical protein
VSHDTLLDATNLANTALIGVFVTIAPDHDSTYGKKIIQDVLSNQYANGLQFCQS